MSEEHRDLEGFYSEKMAGEMATKKKKKTTHRVIYADGGNGDVLGDRVSDVRAYLREHGDGWTKKMIADLDLRKDEIITIDIDGDQFSRLIPV